MRTMSRLILFFAFAVVLTLLGCTKETSPTSPYDGPHEFQPLLKLAKGLSVDDIGRAEAVVTGSGIKKPLSFVLLVNRTDRKLYGTLRLPEGITSCDVAIYIYDTLDRKIGQGSYSLTPSHFQARRCVTAEIGVGSARPRIDFISPHTAVGINDAIDLRAAASDSFGGAIVKYEWKFGGSAWIQTTTGDTSIIAPATAQAYECSLRVTDDDGNTGVDAVVIMVETRAPTANAGSDTSVGINDVIHLRGRGTDTHGGTIVKYEWKFGGSAWIQTTTGDTSIIAPATAQAYVCSLRVTDDDENTGVDAVVITVETRPPTVVVSPDTAVFAGEQANLRGSASHDETRIVEFAWKIGDGNWVVSATGDTTITTPAAEQTLLCSLRVTDDDGNKAYGRVRVFVTGTTVSDADGNTYTVIRIGSQFWTVENLRTTKYNDGTPIPHVTDGDQWASLTTGAYCFYDNSTDTALQRKYGALYNWYAVNMGKLAPAGWHVPSDSEWTVLENYLIANGYNWDGTTTGNKIGKSLAAKTDWASSGTPGAVGNDLASNNRTGFSALPGGYRYIDGVFVSQSNLGNWWSATAFDASYAYSRYLSYSSEILLRNSVNKHYGFSVRLLRGIAY